MPGLILLFLAALTHSANADVCDNEFLPKPYALTERLPLSGKSFMGYLETTPGQFIFTKFKKPTRKDAPVFVLINGLVYPNARWEKTARILYEQGYGVIQYDLANQARSLQFAKNSKFVSTQDHADHLAALMDRLDLQTPAHVVGLSYGSSVATEFSIRHPNKHESLVLLSPLVSSPEKNSAVGAMTLQSLNMAKLWGMTTYEFMYEQTYRTYFRTNIKHSPYYGVELSLYQNSLFELAKAVRDFDLTARIVNVNKKVHLVLADKEESAARSEILQVSKRLSESKPDHSFVVMKDTYHATPDTNPYGTAQYLASRSLIRPAHMTQAVQDQLVGMFMENNHAYHNIFHIQDMLGEFREAKHLLDHPEEVELAIWFHDAVYDPKSKMNEENSVTLFDELMKDAPLDEAARERIRNLILVTKKHAGAKTMDEKFMCDIDLSILGKPPEVFARYDAGIRSEYKWVDKEEFANKRAAVLKSFHERERIYQTDFFKKKFEAQARINTRPKN